MGIFSVTDDEPLSYTGSVNTLHNIMLDEKDFSCLVRGGIIHMGNLRIVLKDIGFDIMEQSLDSALAGKDIYKDHVKEIIRQK